MTRLSDNQSNTGSRAGSPGDPMHHPPKPATMGLGPDNQPAAGPSRGASTGATADAGISGDIPSGMGGTGAGTRSHVASYEFNGGTATETPADPSPLHARRMEFDAEPAAAPAAAGCESRSIADLFKQLRDEATLLLRQEIELAKTEVTNKVNRTTKAATSIAAGGAVAAVGGLLLLIALSCLIGAIFDWFIDDLATSTALAIGFGIVGLTTAVIGYTVYAAGRKKLSETSLTPDRTLHTLQDDKQWLTNKIGETTHPQARPQPAPTQGVVR